ncbi:hypothetical protein GCM10009117_22280 [Gangjinia marincola]|uniref:Crotonobetainyl-CoA--carnitine CoA-transferase n=1 Tax=Gangjinia marincola TaxID=578463 RepID=A0ABN1MIM4_9FLAO
MTKNIHTKDNFTPAEVDRRTSLAGLLEDSPIPPEELIANLALYIPKTEFSRMLYIHELYKQILDVHGVIMEFGVRWGQNMALYETFRGIYEPFNRLRKIVGFDTFEGFPSVHEKDGDSSIVKEGGYNVTKGYEDYLKQVMNVREQEGVTSPLDRHELVKGDASKTIHDYLQRNPQTVISLAYFDFDIYEPNKECLQAIKPYLTKGSIVAFDEINHEDFPGETVALREVFGLDRYKLVHTPYSAARCYLVID